LGGARHNWERCASDLYEVQESCASSLYGVEERCASGSYLAKLVGDDEPVHALVEALADRALPSKERIKCERVWGIHTSLSPPLTCQASVDADAATDSLGCKGQEGGNARYAVAVHPNCRSCAPGPPHIKAGARAWHAPAPA